MTHILSIWGWRNSCSEVALWSSVAVCFVHWCVHWEQWTVERHCYWGVSTESSELWSGTAIEVCPRSSELWSGTAIEVCPLTAVNCGAALLLMCVHWEQWTVERHCYCGVSTESSVLWSGTAIEVCPLWAVNCGAALLLWCVHCEQWTVERHCYWGVSSEKTHARARQRERER